jgi:hypothetical protein
VLRRVRCFAVPSCPTPNTAVIPTPEPYPDRPSLPSFSHRKHRKSPRMSRTRSSRRFP